MIWIRFRFAAVVTVVSLLGELACAGSRKELSKIHSGSEADFAGSSVAPLVFIPGVKGSELVNSRGERGWLSTSQAFDFSTPSLSLPMEWEGSFQKKDDWVPAEILSRVTVIPLILEEKIYGPWMEAASSWGRPFYPFSYDWRRDNAETLERFETMIQKVRAAHHGVRVQVVAHSMGGLIALALLNRHPEYFERVVFAGVPFSGGIGFLEDLHAGTKAGLNADILSPDVLFTFPSIYTLFPLPGRESDLVDRDGRPLPVDFFNSDDWLKYKVGRAGLSGDPKASLFLKQALAHARAFRELLAPLDSAKRSGVGGVVPATVPVLVIAGNSRPTLEKAVQGGPKSVRGWDFKSATRVPGDGRVCEKHAFPPKGIPYEKFSTDAEHAQILNDEKVIQKIKDFLKP